MVDLDAATAAEVMKSLRVRWVVRQQVRTVKGAWLVDVFESEYARVAEDAYNRFSRENPGDYFEFVGIVSTEACRAFTKRPGDGNG